MSSLLPVLRAPQPGGCAGRRAAALALAIALAVGPGAGCADPRAGGPQGDRAAPAARLPVSEAISQVEARLEARPHSAADRAWLAQLYLRRGREQDRFPDFERAEALAREALSLAPGHAHARSALVGALQAQHEFESALALAREAIAADPDDLGALAAATDCLMELGRYREGERRLEQLLERDRSAGALARLARWQELSGRPHEAIGTIEQALEAERRRHDSDASSAAWLHWRLGSLRFGAGELAAAAAAFERALEEAPADPAALAGLAGVRAAEGRFTDAVTLYERSVELREEPPAVWALGELWEARGDLAQAGRWYARAEALIRAEAATSAGEAHRREAARFFADRRRETAYALQKARADLSERNDVYSWDAYAWALFAADRAAEAEAAARRALRLGTRDAWLHYHAGRIALATGDRAAGRLQLERALAINPHFSPLHAAKARELLAGP